MRPARRRPAAAPLLAAAIVLLVAAVYAQTARHEFVSYDDGLYLYKNAVVRGGLTRAGAAWAFGAHAQNWHPLTWLSHMLDVQLFGLRAGAHHLVSAALHAANAALLFALARSLTGALWPAALAAALFAAHPLRVESVAWAAERKDVLSALFGLLAIAAHARYARRPGLARYLPVPLLLALSLLAKPTFVTLPLLLLLLDWWPLGRLRPGSPVAARRVLLEKLPLAALAAASAAATLIAQVPGGGGVNPGLAARLANAAVSCTVYLRQSLWPARLAVLYPLPPGGQPPAAVLLAVVLLGGLSAAVLLGARRRPSLAAGWGWYLAALLPVIGIVQVGAQAHADRYTYLPHAGLSLALAGLARGAAGGRRQATLVSGAAAVALVALAAASHAQAALWRSGVDLFRHTAAVTRDNYVILNNLGLSLTAESRADEAVPVLEQALRIRPGYVNALYNLGLAHASTGRCREAIPWFEQALGVTPFDADAHYYLGICLRQEGRPAEAAERFRRAVALNPGHLRARAELASIAPR